MTERVILVTDPDDVLLDGVRLLFVNLTPEQQTLISETLGKIESTATVIAYMWNAGNPVSWLLDKHVKCDLIISNADCDNSQMILGYIIAQTNSHYFGTLKDLHMVNDRAIYNAEQLFNLLEKTLKQNG
jgi:hypothetical protein